MRISLDRERIEHSSQFSEAVEFQKTFDYSNENFMSNAAWILEHAVKRFDSIQAHVRRIGDKADSLIQHVGLIIGVVFVIIGLYKGEFIPMSAVLIALGLLALVGSIACGLLIIAPVDQPHLAAVRKLFLSAERSANLSTAQARVALTYGKAVAGLQVVSSWKEGWLIWGHRLLALGILVLLLSAMAQALWTYF